MYGPIKGLSFSLKGAPNILRGQKFEMRSKGFIKFITVRWQGHKFIEK